MWWIIGFLTFAVFYFGLKLLFLRRRINYILTSLIEDGELEEAKSFFKTAVKAAPHTLSFCPILTKAILNIKDIKSVQSTAALKNFFSELADIYTAEAPQLSFANLFAAGVKKDCTYVQFIKYILNAVQFDRKWQTYHMAGILMHEKDICQALKLHLLALKTISVQERNQKLKISAAESYISALIESGYINCAYEFTSKYLAEEDADDTENTYLTAILCIIADLQGKTSEAADKILAADSSRLKTVLLPYAVHFSLKSHNSVKALHFIKEASEAWEFKAPKWCTDILRAQISVIGYITESIDKKSAADVPDTLIKNLREAADLYADNKIVQIIAADTLYSAGRYNLSLIYFQRAQKLQNNILISENLDPDSLKENELNLTLLFSDLDMLPFSSGYKSVTEVMFNLYMKLGRDEDAKNIVKSSAAIKEINDLKKISADKFNSLSADQILSLVYACQAEKDQDKFEKLYEFAGINLMLLKMRNHITGREADLKNLEKVLAVPECFGSIDYYQCSAQRTMLKDPKDPKALQALKKAFSCAPGSNETIRLLIPPAAALKDTESLRRAYEYLQKSALSAEDLYYLNYAEKELSEPQQNTEPADLNELLKDFEAISKSAEESLKLIQQQLS